MSVIVAAVLLAGCTTTTTQPGTSATATPGTGSPTQQATAAASANNEKTWPVNSTHESGPGSIHGTVTLVSGGPAAGYALYIWADAADEDKDPAFAMVRTDANGNYEIKDIPNGYYSPRIPHRAGDGGYGEYSQIHVEGDTVWDDTTQK
jgi:protocatechuate 3,4-dioxygenase beta subunit